MRWTTEKPSIEGENYWAKQYDNDFCPNEIICFLGCEEMLVLGCLDSFDGILRASVNRYKLFSGHPIPEPE